MSKPASMKRRSNILNASDVPTVLGCVIKLYSASCFEYTLRILLVLSLRRFIRRESSEGTPTWTPICQHEHSSFFYRTPLSICSLALVRTRIWTTIHWSLLTMFNEHLFTWKLPAIVKRIVDRILTSNETLLIKASNTHRSNGVYPKRRVDMARLLMSIDVQVAQCVHDPSRRLSAIGSLIMSDLRRESERELVNRTRTFEKCIVYLEQWWMSNGWRAKVNIPNHTEPYRLNRRCLL